MNCVFSAADTIVYCFPTHGNELVLDRSQSTVTDVFIVALEPGEAPPLHKHPDTEQVFGRMGFTEVARDASDLHRKHASRSTYHAAKRGHA